MLNVFLFLQARRAMDKYGSKAFGRRMIELRAAGTKVHDCIERVVQLAPKMRAERLKLERVQHKEIEVRFAVSFSCELSLQTFLRSFAAVLPDFGAFHHAEKKLYRPARLLQRQIGSVH